MTTADATWITFTRVVFFGGPLDRAAVIESSARLRALAAAYFVLGRCASRRTPLGRKILRFKPFRANRDGVTRSSSLFSPLRAEHHLGKALLLPLIGRIAFRPFSQIRQIYPNYVASRSC